ncbi:MAG TPA: YceI family protein [Bacteroidia bacterium]|nr:YceI family protein [Bacteroidia bacterium]
MKTTIILSAVLAAFTLTSLVNKKPHSDTYRVDVKQSSLEWAAQKVTGKHNGTIMLSGGEITNNHGNFTGTIEIDMTTIEDKDMEPGKGKEKLEGHLKSADFFDAATYPKSKFVITSIVPVAKPTEGASHTVKGMLTIKDKTNELSFDAVIKISETQASCVGTAVVDRSKFDVKFGSKSFFPDIGDKMIYDEFTLKFNVVAVK